MDDQQNLRIVQGAYAAFKRGDIPGVLNTLANDVDWFTPGPAEIIPISGQRRGREQVAEFFSKLAETQEAEHFEPREFIAQGDKVVALGHYRWRVKSTGRTFDCEWAHVFTFSGGKVVNFREYLDTHAAVAAYSVPSSAAEKL